MTANESYIDTLLQVGGSVKYTCATGHRIVGSNNNKNNSASVFCKSDGTWTVTPTCERKFLKTTYYCIFFIKAVSMGKQQIASHINCKHGNMSKKWKNNRKLIENNTFFSTTIYQTFLFYLIYKQQCKKLIY